MKSFPNLSVFSALFTLFCLFSTGCFSILYGACIVKIGDNIVQPDKYSIVISDNAPEYERFAAQELSEYLKKITGIILPIIRQSQYKTPYAIFVGTIQGIEKFVGTIDVNSLGDEGFVIRSRNGFLALAGGKRGALYSVYTLLEDYLGCGWYMPGPLGEVIPTEGTFNLTDIEDRQKPSFEARQMSSIYDPLFMVHNKCDPTVTGGSSGIDKGDPAIFGTWGHIFDELVEPGMYYIEHPEYFSLVKGKRIWDGGQICTSNLEVAKVAAGSMGRIMDTNPENKIYSICQDDGYGWCECAECNSLDTQKGKISDRLITFCNAAGRILKKSHPDKLIYTFAYTEVGGDPPLRVKPVDNLVIQITHYSPCCHIHPIATCSANVRMKQRLEGWTKLCDRVYVYDYRVDYRNYLMPYPNSYAIAHDIPYYHDIGVKGMFYQGGSDVSQHGMGHWLITKLMWNHKADAEKLFKRFFEQYFQSAAKPMERYFRMLHEKVWRDNIEMNLYSRPLPELSHMEFFNEAQECFEQALKLSNSDIVRQRIERERVPLYWVHLKVSRGTFPQNSRTPVRWISYPGWKTGLADFIRIASRENMTDMCESSGSGPMYLYQFAEEILGMPVHDTQEYRYLRGSEAHSGEYCIFTQLQEGGDDLPWRIQPIVLKGNTRYKFSAWIKFEPGDYSAAVNCFIIPGIYDSHFQIRDKSGWTQYSAVFTTPDTASVIVSPQPGRLHSVGKMWIDDVVLAEESTPNKNLIDNGDFEIARGTQPRGCGEPEVTGKTWLEFSPIRELLKDLEKFQIQ
ncbi:MAG: DUF4838 domain-containing protein [Patescibacteria group bacterium]|nr:DUF4838 domain-containing protein [Patescibacteria group bacterium]